MREFSDSIKFTTVRENLEKHNGRICCEICGAELKTINDGHFDHVIPYAKGGKSTKDNCQLLCSNCNLKKNDKELNDFLLDEKARKFIEGINISENLEESTNVKVQTDIQNKELTKDEFDVVIKNFINKTGKINKVDFSREYNNLPSYKYVKKYYGELRELKKAFNLNEAAVWKRDSIKEALENYINMNGDVFEKDLKTKNGLPSYPCIMKYYPEYKGLNELKKDLFELKVREEWTKEKVIEAGKKYVEKTGKITLKDMKTENNLPTSKVIYNFFGTMENYQKIIGAPISKKNELITMEEIDEKMSKLITKGNRIFETRKDFFEVFPISESVIYRTFNTFENFCQKYNITIVKTKKAKYTKQEIDNVILEYIKKGNQIPNAAKQLVPLGLPSRDAIMKYYEDWHEPFVLYTKLYEKIN